MINSRFPWTGIVIGALLMIVVGVYVYVSSDSNIQPSKNQQKNNNEVVMEQGKKNRQCGNWNGLSDGAESKVYNESEKYFPSDFHLPSGIRHLGTIGGQKQPEIITDPEAPPKLYGMYYYCSTQTVDEVSKYIFANNPTWNVQESNIKTLLPGSALFSSNKKADGMTYNLDLFLQDAQGFTVINVNYSGFK